MMCLGLIVGPDAVSSSPGPKVPVIAVRTVHVPRPLTQPLHVSSIVCVDSVREGALTKV